MKTSPVFTPHVSPKLLEALTQVTYNGLPPAFGGTPEFITLFAVLASGMQEGYRLPSEHTPQWMPLPPRSSRYARSLYHRTYAERGF